MEVVQGVGIVIGLQFNDTTPTDIGAGLLRSCSQPWGQGGVGFNPDSVLVCLGGVMVPEPVALQIAIGAGQWSEASVAGRLPIDVLDVEPLGGISSLVMGR